MKVLREILAALGLLFTVGVVMVHYGSLPQKIPTHFDARGVVNGWGDKSMLWMVVGVACFIYLVMTLVAFLSPNKMSLPVSAERREAAAPIAMKMIGWLKVEIVWTFAVLCAMMVRDALGKSSGLSVWFVPVEMTIVGVTIGYYLQQMARVPRPVPRA